MVINFCINQMYTNPIFFYRKRFISEQQTKRYFAKTCIQKTCIAERFLGEDCGSVPKYICYTGQIQENLKRRRASSIPSSTKMAFAVRNKSASMANLVA